jgi:hypothetical protein
MKRTFIGTLLTACLCRRCEFANVRFSATNSIRATSALGRSLPVKATAVTRKQPLNAEWLVISAQQAFFVRALEVR